MQSKPLTNIRVLDLSRILAAPWAVQMLGDWGAEVIKVERPRVGDDSRRFGPPFLKDADGRDTLQSAFFISANRNKKSVTVDLSQPAGQDLVRRLAAQSDVLVENYKVGDLKRYGLDYESLRTVNPRLVYCSVTGFGQTGPYAARPGYDTVFQAMGGLMSTTGLGDEQPGGGPMKTGPSLADILAGQFALSAIMAALYHRDQHSGEGQHLDVSLLDSVVAAMSHYASHYLVGGQPPVRRGTEGNGGMPSRLYRCADQDIVLVAGNQEQFNRLCQVLGCPGVIDMPEFRTVALRGVNRRQLAEVMEPLFAARQAAEVLDALEHAGVPAGPINDMAQVFADPHVVARAMEVRVPCQTSPGATVRMVGNPVKYSATPVDSYTAAPTLGQHTHQVLSDLLGLDAAEIDRLAAAAVI
jgi:crotonobetainyl-CoA:carnitine CoA-transferase CaiB-like acyl-CoA transferase